MVKVECIQEYDDLLLKERIPVGKQFEVAKDRADYLANERKLVKVVEVIPEGETPETKAPEKKTVAKKQNKKK